MARVTPSILRSGAFELSLENRELRKNGVLIRLSPQPLQVLALLMERCGDVVTREEIQNLLWGGNITVEFEGGLNRCIARIRTALSDDADNPRFVQTVPKTGYRFVAPVQVTVRSSGNSLFAGEAPPPSAVQSDLTLDIAAEEATAPPSTSPSVPEMISSPENISGASNAELDLPPRDLRRARRSSRYRSVIVLSAIGGAVVLGIVIWLWKALSNERRPTSLTALPLASELGDQYAPSFSPDGHQVAFVWNGERKDNFDIYIKLADSSSSKIRLTQNPAVDYSPAWSPDGKWMAFCRGRQDEPGAAILIMPALGGPERKLADLPQYATPGARVFSWTPDSNGLVVQSPVSKSPSDGLVLINTADGAKKILTRLRPGEKDLTPAVSPDGKSVVFAHEFGSGLRSIQIVSLADGTITNLNGGRKAFSGALNREPAWTPDGKFVAFVSNADGLPHLWMVRAKSSQVPFSLAELGRDLASPAVSASGQLAFVHNAFDDNIWKANLPDASSATTVSAFPAIASSRREANPSVAPDGKQIAFASNRGGFFEIWTSAPDGSNAAPLTALQNPVTGSPVWSPDGRMIAFDSRGHPGPATIFVQPASGGSARPLPCGPGSSVLPAWSRDGKTIYYSSNRSGVSEIWSISVDGTDNRQVTTGGGFGAVVSLDGESLFLVPRDEEFVPLYRFDLKAKKQTLIASEVVKRSYAPSSKGIYFFALEPATDERALYFYDTRTLRTRKIFTVTRPPDGGVALSPDEHSLYYTQIDNDSHDLYIVNDFWK